MVNALQIRMKSFITIICELMNPEAGKRTITTVVAVLETLSSLKK